MSFPLPKNCSIDLLLSVAKARAKCCIDNKIVVAEDVNGYPIYQPTSKEEAKKELGEIFDMLAFEIEQMNCSAKALEKISSELAKEFNISEADFLNIYTQNMEEQLQKARDNSYYLNEGETLATRRGFSVIK